MYNTSITHHISPVLTGSKFEVFDKCNMKGKKLEYLCKMKFERMSFGKKVLSENRTLHIKISHKGDKNVKFKIISD